MTGSAWCTAGPPRPGASTPSTRRAPEADLAPDQLAAVDHAAGPARVIAPAGSGKTRVLTERLRLLVRRGTYPGAVTALAYNTRAAEEMRERTGDVLGPDGPHVRTLNSLALWVCNAFGPAGPVRVVDEMGVRDLIGELFEVKRQANTDTTAPFLAALSLIRLGLVSPAAAEEAYPDASGIADGFDGYRATLAERGLVDFDEQIYRAIEILAADPAARAAAQARCRRMLVDEFQDLTPAHLLLIRLLVAPGFDCFGVGDDDQVIYGYSGATPEYLIDFADYFPGAADHPLEVNYRCPPAVVDAARHLLTYNHERVAKTIRSPEGRAGPGADDERARWPGRVRWSSSGRRPTPSPAWPSTSSGPGGPTGSTCPTSPCWPGSTRRSCRSRWPASSRTCRAPRPSPPRCWPGPGSAPPSPTCGSAATPAPSGARTSATPSGDRPAASRPWSST